MRKKKTFSERKKHTKDRGECGSVSEDLPKETQGSQHCTKHKPRTEAQHTGPEPGRSKQKDQEFKVIDYRHSQSQPSLAMRPRLKKENKWVQSTKYFLYYDIIIVFFY